MNDLVNQLADYIDLKFVTKDNSKLLVPHAQVLRSVTAVQTPSVHYSLDCDAASLYDPLWANSFLFQPRAVQMESGLPACSHSIECLGSLQGGSGSKSC